MIARIVRAGWAITQHVLRIEFAANFIDRVFNFAIPENRLVRAARCGGSNIQRTILYHGGGVSHGPFREAQQIDIAAVLLLARGCLRRSGEGWSAERSGRCPGWRSSLRCRRAHVGSRGRKRHTINHDVRKLSLAKDAPQFLLASTVTCFAHHDNRAAFSCRAVAILSPSMLNGSNVLTLLS